MKTIIMTFLFLLTPATAFSLSASDQAAADADADALAKKTATAKQFQADLKKSMPTLSPEHQNAMANDECVKARQRLCPQVIGKEKDNKNCEK
ncbi:MAG: hypothetical protein HN509_13420, partial [Halobacteriovoraceae bacterium]|nr:hypothetical protein [Halobacteriovoraceae bacterium]